MPLILLLVMVVAMLFATAVVGYYMVTREPVTELPAVERVVRGVPPRALFSFAVANPVGIVVSPDGQRIYVAEGGGERLIKVFDREGRLVGQLAPAGSKPGTRKPGLLALDADGRLYAVDRLRGLDRYSAALQWEGLWQPAALETLGGWLLNGVSVGSDGRVYVAEIGLAEHSVLILNPDGSLASRLSKSTGLPGGLTYPVQAVADDEGRIYISDGNAGRVLAISPRGVAVVGVQGEEAVGLPRGLAIVGRKLLVADAASHRIVVFGLGDRPEYLHAYGDSDNDAGLAFPSAVAADRNGRVYVADRANDRVQVWSY